MKDIYHQRESRQGNRIDLESTSGKYLPEVKPTIQAAQAIGISRPTADRAAAVVKTIDALCDGF